MPLNTIEPVVPGRPRPGRPLDEDLSKILQTSRKWEHVDDFEYLEGCIEEFPEVLMKHVDMQDYRRFARTRWYKKCGREQSLHKTSRGRCAKFVLEDDSAMRKLPAGRFRCRGKDQVVVVGISDEKLEEGVRYVIVSLPYGERDRFNEEIGGTKDWKGSTWDVWKPESKFSEYYDKVPSKIYRVEGPEDEEYTDEDSSDEDSPDKDAPDEKSPAGTATSETDSSAQDLDGQDQATVEQQSALPTTHLTTTKRKLSPEISIDQSLRMKKPRGQDEKDEDSTPPVSTSETLETPSDRAETLEAHAGSSPSLSDSPPKSSKQKSFRELGSEQSGPPSSAAAPTSGWADSSISEDTDGKMLLPPQKDPANDNGGVTTTLFPVKQEDAGETSLILPQEPPASRESRSATASHGAQNGHVGPASTPVAHTTAGEPPPSDPAPTSNTSRRIKPINVIDLSDDCEKDTVQPTTNRQTNVSFIDEHGKEQFVVAFDECNTAESMFEEACAWDIADKETRMLEIIIPGCKPARVRKNNEKHFAQKVFEPLKETISRLGQGQSLTLTVQKYM